MLETNVLRPQVCGQTYVDFKQFKRLLKTFFVPVFGSRRILASFKLAPLNFFRYLFTCCRDALATSTINCVTSFFAGFVIFSVLGYMSKKSHKKITEVATEGERAYSYAVA